MRGELPDQSDGVFVVDDDDHYRGVLSFARLLTAQPEDGVAELMDTTVEPIPATLKAADVAREFRERDLIAAPVVDTAGRLLGQITIDDVVDVIQERADQELLSLAGLDQEDDLFAPVLTSSRRRAIWLVLHLGLAFVTASVINLFSATIDEVVLLAVLMPLVATMGGIAGSQTLTLMVRGLALGRIRFANTAALLRKELAVGAVNALLAALVAAAVTVGYFGNWQVAAVIAAALALNLAFAVVVGFSVPLLLRRLGIDPALAGSVVLVTLTDLVGFVAILGLGTWLLV
jgi:magnesium transporter